MRNAFTNALIDKFKKEKEKGDLNSFLLTGDLGFSAFEKIRENYPEHFINMGLSEQNMISVAGGMAYLGKKVYVYSIIPFLLYRTFEQIRNDVCYPNLSVVLVGVGSGVVYANSGPTHHAIEDLKVADALPNITILSPSDPREVSIFMQKIDKINSPVYLRLSRNGEPIIHNKHGEIKIGKPLELSKGSEVLIISIGAITKVAIDVARKLNSEEGNFAELLEVHTFKPFDYKKIAEVAKNKKLVITLEENTGALFEKVSVALNNMGINILPFKLPDKFINFSGTEEYILDRYGISTEKVYKKIKKVLARI